MYSTEGIVEEGDGIIASQRGQARRTVFPSQPAGSERLLLLFVVSAHLHSSRRCLYDQWLIWNPHIPILVMRDKYEEKSKQSLTRNTTAVETTDHTHILHNLHTEIPISYHTIQYYAVRKKKEKCSTERAHGHFKTRFHGRHALSLPSPTPSSSSSTTRSNQHHPDAACCLLIGPSLRIDGV